MTRREEQRLDDIVAALMAIRQYVAAGSLDDSLVFDAVRMRLIEIGEVVKDLPPEVLASESGIPWAEIAGMRDRLAHRYFDTSHTIITATVEVDLPVLDSAVTRLRSRLSGDTPT